MKLSKRLNKIYEMTPYGEAADIGADHGHLIISLIENNKISHGLAIENKKGPFLRLQKAVNDKNLTNKIDVIFSDGIKDILPSTNIVVIAGMGGNTIIDILKKNVEKLSNVEYLIIDAHSAVPKVRKEITTLNYSIVEEEIVYEDNIYYEIIKFQKSTPTSYQDIDYEFGPLLRKNKSELFFKKHQNRLKEIDNLLKQDLPEIKKKTLICEKERIMKVL